MQKSQEIAIFSEKAFKDFFQQNWKRGLSYIYYKYGSEGKVFRKKIIHENQKGEKKEAEIIVKAFSPEELLEDAFLKLYKHSKKYDTTEKFDFNRFKPIIDNHVKDLYRKYGDKKEQNEEESSEQPKQIPTNLLEESIQFLETAEVLKEKLPLNILSSKDSFFSFWKNMLGLALGKLKTEHRLILILRDQIYAGLENKIVVEKLNAKGSISNWYNRARKGIMKEILNSLNSVEKDFIKDFYSENENYGLWKVGNKDSIWSQLNFQFKGQNQEELITVDEINSVIEITGFSIPNIKNQFDDFLSQNKQVLFPLIILSHDKPKNNPLVKEIYQLLYEVKPIKLLKHKKLLFAILKMLIARYISGYVGILAEDKRYQ